MEKIYEINFSRQSAVNSQQSTVGSQRLIVLDTEDRRQKIVDFFIYSIAFFKKN